MVEHQERHIEGPRQQHSAEVGEVTRGAEVKVRNDADLSRPENTTHVAARASTSDVVHPMSISTGSEGDPKPVKSGDLERYKSKSLLELAKAGVIVDKTSAQPTGEASTKPAGDVAAKPAGDAKPMEAGAAQPQRGPEKHATLTVDAAPAAKARQAKPDIVVKSDGTVEMHANPAEAGYKKVSIMMETKDDETPPTKEQTEALAEITKHIAPEMQKNGPVEVVDKKALVPEEVVEGLGLVDGETHSLPEQTAKNVRNLNNLDRQIRQSPGGSGMPSSGEGSPDSYIPQRTERQPHETDAMVTKKDIIAGIINADHAKPYESVRTNIDGSLALGRYGLNFQLLDYFMDELGEPPNEAMLAKLPKSLRDKLSTKEGRAAFREFASKLKAGGGADPKNQEFIKEFAQVLPKESQEAIAEAIIDKAGPKLGDDNAKLAFMFQTGQRPDQMTAANFEKPEFKQMETAVKRLGEMAQTRQHVDKDTQHISWDSHGKVGVGHGRWLSGDAGNAFNAAQAEARQHGLEIKLNSAGRTHSEQWALYRELKPRGGRVAYPGTSNHEKGGAIDVANYDNPKVRQILAKHGFEWGDGRGPMQDDLVHFKYTGRNRTYNA